MTTIILAALISAILASIITYFVLRGVFQRRLTKRIEEYRATDHMVTDSGDACDAARKIMIACEARHKAMSWDKWSYDREPEYYDTKVIRSFFRWVHQAGYKLHMQDCGQRDCETHPEAYARAERFMRERDEERAIDSIDRTWNVR